MDRFCGSSLSKAMIERIDILNENSPDFLKKLGTNNKPLGWIRSHSVCVLMNFFEKKKKKKNDHLKKETILRKLGLGNPENKTAYHFEEYDTIMFSLFQDDHWSLMVCYVQNMGIKHIYHYDSLYPFHLQYASQICEALCYFELLDKDYIVHSVSGYPIQEKTFECGYAVLLMVSCICNQYKECDKIEDINRGVSPISKDKFPVVSPARAIQISEIILNFLGSSKGDYPPEILNQDLYRDKNVKPSLLTYYNHFRSRMIETNRKNVNNTNIEINDDTEN